MTPSQRRCVYSIERRSLLARVETMETRLLELPGPSLSIVDQAFSICYHHSIQNTCYYLWRRFPAPPVQKGGVEMTRSARRATSIPGMKGWSCMEDARRT